MKNKMKKLLPRIIAFILCMVVVVTALFVALFNVVKKTMKSNYQKEPSVINYFDMMEYLSYSFGYDALDYVDNVFDFSDDELAQYANMFFGEERCKDKSVEYLADMMRSLAIARSMQPCILWDNTEMFRENMLKYLPKINAENRVKTLLVCCQYSSDYDFFAKNSDMVIEVFEQLAEEEKNPVEKMKCLITVCAFVSVDNKKDGSIDGCDNNLVEEIGELCKSEQVSEEFEKDLTFQYLQDNKFYAILLNYKLYNEVYGLN